MPGNRYQNHMKNIIRKVTKQMGKGDCFAYINGKCNALKKMYCEEGECDFYKKKGTECESCLDPSILECVNCKVIRKQGKHGS